MEVAQVILKDKDGKTLSHHKFPPINIKDLDKLTIEWAFFDLRKDHLIIGITDINHQLGKNEIYSVYMEIEEETEDENNE